MAAIGAARCSVLDFVQITPLDEGNEFVPFSVRQPNGIYVSPIVTPRSVISTSGHSVQCGQRVNSIGSIWTSFLMVHVGHPTVCSRYGRKWNFR